MTHFQMYLITRLDSIASVLGILFAALFFGSIAGLFIYAVMVKEDDDTRHKLRPYLKALLGSFLVVVILSVAIPSPKDIALIYSVPAIVNNSEAQELPTNVMKDVNAQLKEWADAE